MKRGSNIPFPLMISNLWGRISTSERALMENRSEEGKKLTLPFNNIKTVGKNINQGWGRRSPPQKFLFLDVFLTAAYHMTL